MGSKQLKVNDRVKRLNNIGCHGLIKDIRAELIGSTGEAKEKGQMICVLWDNGTLSYLAPEALEVVESAK